MYTMLCVLQMHVVAMHTQTQGKWCTTYALCVFLGVENIAYRSRKSMKNYRDQGLGRLPAL
jgi:hypothetical protein